MSFDNQNALDIKIDKPKAMMSKLTTQNNNQAKAFKPKLYDRKGEVKAGTIILTEVDSTTKICQIIWIYLKDHYIEADVMT